MKIIALLKEQIDLLSLLSSCLFDNELERIDETSVNAILQESIEQSVLLLVYNKIRSMKLVYDKQYDVLFYEYVLNNIRVISEHSELHSIMEKNNTCYVSFKGCASASYYKNSELRMMGDVDFLVKGYDQNKTINIFQSLDFICDDETQNHISFSKPVVKGNSNVCSVYEIHTCINGLPGGNIGEIISSYFDDIFDKKVEHTIDKGCVNIPSTFHHGLILLIHMVTHLTREGIGLRHLCDWAVFVNSVKNDDFIKMYKIKLQSVGLWDFAQIITNLCEKYLGLPKNLWANDKCVNDELLDELIVDIFQGGNFGKKDLNRYRHIKYMDTNSDDSVVKKMSSALNQKVKRKYPIINEKKYLYPVYSTKVAFEYFIKVISKERKISGAKKVIEDAKIRKNIYYQLKIFRV